MANGKKSSMYLTNASLVILADLEKRYDLSTSAIINKALFDAYPMMLGNLNFSTDAIIALRHGYFDKLKGSDASVIKSGGQCWITASFNGDFPSDVHREADEYTSKMMAVMDAMLGENPIPLAIKLDRGKETIVECKSQYEAKQQCLSWIEENDKVVNKEDVENEFRIENSMTHIYYSQCYKDGTSFMVSIALRSAEEEPTPVDLLTDALNLDKYTDEILSIIDERYGDDGTIQAEWTRAFFEMAMEVIKAQYIKDVRYVKGKTEFKMSQFEPYVQQELRIAYMMPESSRLDSEFRKYGMDQKFPEDYATYQRVDERTRTKWIINLEIAVKEHFEAKK